MTREIFIPEGRYAYLPVGEPIDVHILGLSTCLLLVLKSEQAVFVVHIDTHHGELSELIHSAIEQLGTITYARIYGGEDAELAKRNGSVVLYETVREALSDKRVTFERDTDHCSTIDKHGLSECCHCDVDIFMREPSEMTIKSYDGMRRVDTNKISILKRMHKDNESRMKLNPTRPSLGLIYSAIDKCDLPVKPQLENSYREKSSLYKNKATLFNVMAVVTVACAVIVPATIKSMTNSTSD